MPLLQPPDPDLRPSDYSYTHAYNSIVSRVRRGAGSGSGGVVIFSGVDIVRPRPEGIARKPPAYGYSGSPAQKLGIGRE